jgi:hypothetical protein
MPVRAPFGSEALFRQAQLHGRSRGALHSPSQWAGLEADSQFALVKLTTWDHILIVRSVRASGSCSLSCLRVWKEWGDSTLECKGEIQMPLAAL